MRVVIAGAGSVGRSIANELLLSGHQVMLVDRSPSAMRVGPTLAPFRKRRSPLTLKVQPCIATCRRPVRIVRA